MGGWWLFFEIIMLLGGHILEADTCHIFSYSMLWMGVTIVLYTNINIYINIYKVNEVRRRLKTSDFYWLLLSGHVSTRSTNHFQL